MRGNANEMSVEDEHTQAFKQRPDTFDNGMIKWKVKGGYMGQGYEGMWEGHGNGRQGIRADGWWKM